MREYDRLYCGGRYDPYAHLTWAQAEHFLLKSQESLSSWQALEEGADFYHLKDSAIDILID
jgi:hypothetical protein